MLNNLDNTGEAILFLDLSSDPALFNGQKGDIQVRNFFVFVFSFGFKGTKTELLLPNFYIFVI